MVSQMTEGYVRSVDALVGDVRSEHDVAVRHLLSCDTCICESQAGGATARCLLR